jgi:hypothetical protein
MSSNEEQDWDRAERLYALALQARDNNLTDCAVELEELAVEASAQADGASSELQRTRPAMAALRSDEGAG